jgi:hypothetical protein
MELINKVGKKKTSGSKNRKRAKENAQKIIQNIGVRTGYAGYAAA